MKAIALVSGGLDSLLAVKVAQGQGIEVLTLHFKIPFCRPKPLRADHCPGPALKEIDIGEDFLEIIKSPRYGFGSNMNPCIDCKILMLKKARELMPQLGASFVITGEVLGQRPMSQNRQTLELIEKRSGLSGLIVRPLSAKLLAMSAPEKEGWVNRQGFLGLAGRGRKEQFALAAKFGLKEFAQPAGGCLLTDPEFAKRLKELIAHKELSLQNVTLLKMGRHFRLGPNTKLIVGRNEKENMALEGSGLSGDYLFRPNENLAGPTSLGRGRFTDELIKLACSITCRYCDLNGSREAKILGTVLAGNRPSIFEAQPLEEDKLISLRI